MNQTCEWIITIKKLIKMELKKALKIERNVLKRRQK